MRNFLISVLGTLITGSLFAGGLVTNTNQSALYTRLQSRNASTGIDAVYYNPAGLTKLGDGFFLSVNNQTIGQTRSVLNNYAFLNGSPKEYIGTVSAPLFPSVYAAFKAGKFVVSAGFNPIGGGGGAKYEDGLPSFEMPISYLVPTLVGQLTPLDQGIQALTGNDPGFRNVTGYSSDISFEGTSTYFGLQANVSYEINDFISAAVGARYVTAKNTYKGHIKDVKVNAPTAYGGSQAPGNYLRFIAAVPGVPPATAAQLNGTAAILDVATNVEVDAEQTGSGFAPILSLNISPIDNLNIALKYEFKTKLELTTKVFDNKGGGVFTDGQKNIADMPAMFAAGVEFRPIDRLMVTGSMNMYFDKNVDYDGSASLDVNLIDKNFTEYAFGAEVGLTKRMRLSAGWLGTFTGVNDSYQNDQRYSLNTNSLGGGLGIRILPVLDLNIGGQYTIYKEGSKNIGTTQNPITEVYNKDTWVIGAGLDFYFGRK
jgi:opacity protein-like surface antigen